MNLPSSTALQVPLSFAFIAIPFALVQNFARERDLRQTLFRQQFWITNDSIQCVCKNQSLVMTSIFLSHNHNDKPFARRLAEALLSHSVRAWVDEYEVKVGDSLIKKVSDGIQECEFLAVILSPSSVASEWVTREVNIALTQEIRGKKVKVLPILVQDCRIPAFLQDKLYADFTFNFDAGLVSLLRALGKDVTTILGVSTHGPFIQEFSEADWRSDSADEFFLLVPRSQHGKQGPSSTVQMRADGRWLNIHCNESVSENDDVRIGAGCKFAGRIIVK